MPKRSHESKICGLGRYQGQSAPLFAQQTQTSIRLSSNADCVFVALRLVFYYILLHPCAALCSSHRCGKGTERPGKLSSKWNSKLVWSNCSTLVCSLYRLCISILCLLVLFISFSLTVLVFSSSVLSIRFWWLMIVVLTSADLERHAQYLFSLSLAHPRLYWRYGHLKSHHQLHRVCCIAHRLANLVLYIQTGVNYWILATYTCRALLAYH